MDFKVRCTISDGSGAFTVGRIYLVEKGTVTLDNGDKDSGFNSIGSLNRCYVSQFELVADKPHICEILGNGRPLEVDEYFEFDGVKYNVQLSSSGDYFVYKGGSHFGSVDLGQMINHPEKIIRQPQFSEDEKAFMKEFAKAGFPIFYRCAANSLRIKKIDSSNWIALPNSMLPSLTVEVGEVNAAEYLEGLK